MKIGTIVKSKSYGYLVVVGEEHQIIGNRVCTMAVDRFGVKHPLDGTESIVTPPKKKMPDGKTPQQIMKELYAPKPGMDYPTHEEMRETVNKIVVAAFNELTGEFATIDFASRIAADFARNEAKKVAENIKQIEPGRDVPTFEQCYELAENVARSLIEKIEREEIKIETGESIKNKLELLTGNFRLDASAIKNLPKPVVNQMMPGKGSFGGDSFTARVRASEDDQVPGFLEEKLVAGSNITLAVSGTGRERTITISASGSGISTIDGSGTANELAYWVDTDTLGTLPVATYPNLTQLSFLKGVTSAIQTQLDGKQREIEYDVRDYGALFDGSTDDKAAIQSALDAANAAGGGIVIMPEGTAKLSGTLTMYANCTLRGQGKNSTKLQTTAVSGALPDGTMIVTGTSSDYMTFEGFELIGHGETMTSGTGISLPTGVHSFIIMRDLYVHGFPNHGIHVVDPILSSFEDLRLGNNGQDGIFIDIGTSCFLKTIYAHGNNRSGIHLKSNTYSHITNCAAEYNTFGYWMENSHNWTMSACGGEVAMRADGGSAGLVAHYRIQSCVNFTINSCYSSQFAYLSGTPAYHWYFTASQRGIFNAARGFADLLNPGDPHEAPTNTVSIDGTSEIHANSVFFSGEVGGGVSGSFKSEINTDGNISVLDEAYGAGWNGSLEVPTKNAIYDKIETLPGGHDAVTVTDSSEINFTLTGQDITASLVAGSIDETKLDTSVNASLALAGTSVQVTGAQTIDGVKTFRNNTDSASVQVAVLEGDRATPTDNDEAYVSLKLSDDSGVQTEIARLSWVASDVNSGTSVDGLVKIGVMTAGTLADELILSGTALYPAVNNGLALGTSTNMFGSLRLVSGGAINFNNSAVTIIHSAGLLTLAGADFVVPDEAYDATAWNGSLEVPTKNAVRDKIETLLPSSSYTAADVLSKLLTVDGAGSGLDADLLDGNSSAAFATAAQGTTADNALPKAGGTMTGDITLSENTSIALDPAGSADGKYSGITVAGTAGAALAFGDLVYLAAADSRWELVDADSVATSGDVMLGICVLAAAADGDATKILLHGIIRADSKFPALTVSAQVYASTTPGAIQVAQPSGTDDVIRVVGRALTVDEIYFNPSEDYGTHV